MLVVMPQGVSVIGVELRVAGEDTVTVPAGTFPSWLVVIKGDQVDQRLWIAKDGQAIVKVAISVPQMPGTLMETVLAERSER